MMNLTLHLTPETEAKLKEQAAHSGKTLEAVALEALEEKLGAEPAAADLPLDEWEAKLDEWLLSHKPRNPTMDDRRESIYPDPV